LQTNRELAEIDMRNNKARYLPTLDISFAWGINAGADNFGDLGRFGDETIWPDYQLTGLALYVPIFNGGYRTSTFATKQNSDRAIGIPTSNA
jgi:outer membrane protein TolC